MKYVLILTISFILSYCNSVKDKKSNYKKIYDFELIHEATLPLPSDIKIYSHFDGYKLIVSSEDSVLIIPFLSDKRILFYSLSKKKILKDIDISKISIYDLSNVYCFNQDSFLLTYTYHGYSFEEYSNDSLMYILKVNDNKINAYKINIPKSKHFCLRKSDFKDSAYVYPSFSGNHLVFYNNKLVVPYDRLTTYKIGTKEFVRLNVPVCGIYDFNKEKIIDANFFDFPYVKHNVFYPSDIRDKYYCLANNKIFFRYFYSKDIFIIDSNARYIEKKELKSLLVDSIYPFKIARNSHWGAETINAIYLHLNYDNYRKLFYSYIIFPFHRYGKSFSSLIIADSSLNYVNELVNKFKISYNSIFTDKYIISIRSKQNKIELKYYQLVTKQITEKQYANYINEYRDSLKIMEIQEINKICNLIPNNKIGNSKNISDYISKIQNIKDSTFCSIYVYTDMVCESCVHNVLFDFMINQVNYEKLPIYLHLSGTNKSITKLLNQYYLKNYKKLYIDTNSVYKYFDPFDDATVRMVLYSNDSIQSDTIYTPKGLDTMMNRCYHFFEKYLKIKN